MSASYLHGVETIESAAGVRPVLPPPTCVVGLVGTAPHPLGTNTRGKATLVTNHAQAAAFGPDVPGYTIPNALKRILAYGSALVVVVDVFDPELHGRAVENEIVRIAENGEARLANAGVWGVSLVMDGETLTEGEDYTLDAAAGIVRRVKASAKLPPGGAPLATYQCADFEGRADEIRAAVVGGESAAGERTGVQALFDAPATLGVKPTRLIAPGFATPNTAVGTALVGAAERLRSRAILDVPPGVTVAEVIASRSGADAPGVPALGMSNGRAEICFPFVRVPGPGDGLVLEPMSQHIAGLACSVDAREGFWCSVSNHELLGVVGLDVPIEWSLSDPNCEANRLNAVGVTCAVRPPNAGFRAWGNRSTAFPVETHPVNFNCVRDTADIIHAAIERSMLPWLDRPLSRPLLGSIRESVLLYLDGLLAKGAIMGHSFDWPKEDNPEDRLAMGHVTYALSFLPALPMERVTIKSSIDTAWLRNL
jgi:phage tail sheath protein FI